MVASSNSLNRELLVDCDNHPVPPEEWKTLLPYMTPSSRRSVVRSSSQPSSAGEAGRPVARYAHPSPTGNLRGDAAPPSGKAAGSDPRFAVKDHLDARGVDAAVLIPLAYEGWLRVEPEAIATALNEYLIDQWMTVDSRFKLAAVVLPTDIGKAVEEVRRRSTTPGVVGISLRLADLPMGHPHHYPIYAEAADAQLPIVVHPNGSESTFLSGPSSAGGVPSTFLERHVTLSQAASSSLCSMVWRGVFDMFPSLKVVLVEYGFTWVPWLASQMDREWHSLGKSDRPTRLEPSQYIWNQVRFTTQPLEEPDEASEMIHALEAIHADRTVLFSSDYPHWDSDDPNRVLTYLDRRLRNRICSENALETFGDRLGLTPRAGAPAAVGT